MKKTSLPSTEMPKLHPRTHSTPYRMLIEWMQEVRIMTVIDLSAEVARARVLRQRIELDQIDYRRELNRLSHLGSSQRQVSSALGISQPSLSTALKTAEKVPPARPGFSGASPYEICQRFAIGELTRDQVIDELTRWEYVIPEAVEHDYFDDLRFDTPGSFNEVGQAFDDGLIDGATYELVLNATAPAPAPAPEQV